MITSWVFVLEYMKFLRILLSPPFPIFYFSNFPQVERRRRNMADRLNATNAKQKCDSKQMPMKELQLKISIISHFDLNKQNEVGQIENYLNILVILALIFHVK